MSYQKEILKSNNILTGNACYYIVSTSEFATLKDGMELIPPLNAITGAYYFPYLPNQFDDYGKGADSIFAFEECSALETDEGITIEWFIEAPVGENMGGYRKPRRIIKNFPNNVVNLKLNNTINAYTSKPDTVGKQWTYMNESKLQQYPYRYIELNDGLMNPIYLEPQKFQNPTNNEVYVKQYLNPNGVYQIYIKGYCGDEDGRINNWTVEGLDVPIVSNSYVNYKNENKIQNSLFYRSQMFYALNPSNTLTSVGNIVNQVATEEDMKRIPNQMSMGCNYQFGLQNFDCMYNIIHEITEDDMKRIGLYFHQYGYAQNKLMIKPDTTSRKYFNYIKATDCIFTGAIPKFAQEQIKQIMAQGTTIWHMNTSGNYIGNYVPDNVER